MNPGVLFLPVFRASMTAYLLGLALLALLDFWRLHSGIPNQFLGLTAIAVWFFVFSLHANRRRYVGRGSGMAFLPVILAAVAKLITGLVVIFAAVFDQMRAFAAENGVDVSDDEAFLNALADPGFVAAFEEYAEGNEALAIEIAQAAATPSYIAFWLVILAFAPWFAQLKRKGGHIGDYEGTPSMLNPAPLAPAQPEPQPQAEPDPEPEPEPQVAVDAEPEAVADAPASQASDAGEAEEAEEARGETVADSAAEPEEASAATSEAEEQAIDDADPAPEPDEEKAEEEQPEDDQAEEDQDEDEKPDADQPEEKKPD